MNNDTLTCRPFQQYVCTACHLTKRVRMAPSHAPSAIRTGCERCGTQQRHRADGGSGVI